MNDSFFNERYFITVTFTLRYFFFGNYFNIYYRYIVTVEHYF